MSSANALSLFQLTPLYPTQEHAIRYFERLYIGSDTYGTPQPTPVILATPVIPAIGWDDWGDGNPEERAVSPSSSAPVITELCPSFLWIPAFFDPDEVRR